MTDALKIDLLEVLAKHKVIPGSYAKNERIRSEYKLMRAAKVSGKDARKKLADNYFTSEKNIERILYGDRNEKANYKNEPQDKEEECLEQKEI